MSIDRIKKMWYLYTMEYYSAIRRNEVVPFAETWMDLEMIILSESDRERQLSYDITYMWNLKKYTNELIYKTTRLTDRENKLMVTKVGGVGRDKLGVWE